MLAKQAMSRRWRNGFLSACVLTALLGAGCESKTCTSSFECADDELCVRAGGDSYHCRAKCDADGGCADGSACAIVTSADCPTCDVVTRACLANTAPGH
jgi:hypothetical protein